MNPWMLTNNTKYLDPFLIEEFTNRTGLDLPEHSDPLFIKTILDFLSSKDWSWLLSRQKDNYVMTIEVDQNESHVIHTDLNLAVFLCTLDALCSENIQ
jgi:hypothetical protein